MPERNTAGNASKTYWYLMSYRDPERIDEQLKEINNARRNSGQEEIVYTIPYSYLSRIDNREGRKDISLNNSLRSYLHYFVFIKSTKTAISRLLDGEWNRRAMNRLSFRYTHSGEPMKMTDKEMQQLMAIISEYHYRFGLREFSESLLTNVKVRMKKGQFRGKVGSVMKITMTGDKTFLTIGIPVFNNEIIMEVGDIPKEDVEMIGGGVDGILTPYLIKEVEGTMIQILRRRIRHQGDDEDRKKDRDLLNTYGDIFRVMDFNDEEEEKRLLALALLNASLRGDADLKRDLIKKAEGIISNPEKISSPYEAFLLAILFVATRKGIYRKTVKEYVNASDTPMPTLRTLMPILKDINTR